MAKFNGDLMVVKVGATQVAELTNVEITGSTNMFETTTKESGGKKEILPGNSEWSITADVNTNFQSSNWDAADFWAAWKAKTSLTVLVTNGVVGDKEFEGAAYVDNVVYTGPQGDVSTGSISFSGTGDLDIATIV